MIFTPRLTAPDNTDPNWINVDYGGLNRCILGYPSYGYGSVLSDCTGYAWGRWLELLGYQHNLSINQARIWYLNTADGYERSTTTPKLGAVACWDNNGGSGHVAIVERINVDSYGNVSSCLVSESVYGGSPFSLKTIRPSNNWYIYDDHNFQGFIYLPEEPIALTLEELVCLLKKRRYY